MGGIDVARWHSR